MSFLKDYKITRILVNKVVYDKFVKHLYVNFFIDLYIVGKIRQKRNFTFISEGERRMFDFIFGGVSSLFLKRESASIDNLIFK